MAESKFVRNSRYAPFTNLLILHTIRLENNGGHRFTVTSFNIDGSNQSYG